MGHSQSLNKLCKKRTYLESISLRNRLLTYWSETIKINNNINSVINEHLKLQQSVKIIIITGHILPYIDIANI